MTGSSHNGRFVASASAAIFAVLVGLAACGNKPDPAPGVAAAYAADIEKLCNVIELSGATGLEPNDRMYLTATWLGANLTTPEARKLLADIQPLKGAAKANALDAEARRAGLASCALAAEHRK
jgi:hypothetical protein